MLDITCENCGNMKVIPTSHRAYKKYPDAKKLVRCIYNKLMTYHDYTPGAHMYRDIASECYSYDDMDDDKE